MFKAAADDIPTYRTIASGMMHAGLAVALVSMDTESCNHAKCHQWVCDLFGQEGAKKGDLCQNLLRMQQQIRCNSTDVQWMDEAPTVKTKEFIPSDNGIAFTYINEAVGRKRILYASNLWYKLTDFERGATWVHEISHACLGTHDYQAEGGYNPEAVAKFPWPKLARVPKTMSYFACAPSTTSSQVTCSPLLRHCRPRSLRKIIMSSPMIWSTSQVSFARMATSWFRQSATWLVTKRVEVLGVITARLSNIGIRWQRWMVTILAFARRVLAALGNLRNILLQIPNTSIPR